MYNKIYDFCKVRNLGNCFKNGNKPTPRVNFITSLCEEMGIDYEIDSFTEETKGKNHSVYDFDEILSYIPENRKKEAEEIYNDFLKKNRKLDQSISTAKTLDVKRNLIKEIYKLEDDTLEKLRSFADKNMKNTYFNIILKGTSDKFVVAHHDIVNKDLDNANDNSCSVINAIMIKKLRPEVNVVLLDGEEYGGIGSNHLSKRIINGDFPCKWVLNLELSGKGGRNFFVGDLNTPLSNWISDRFMCPSVIVPFNDSVIFKKYGINTALINPLPLIDKPTKIKNDQGYLDISYLFNCHTKKDSVNTIDPADMKEFVEEICLKIIDEA